jgi:hypothetical protein
MNCVETAGYIFWYTRPRSWFYVWAVRRIKPLARPTFVSYWQLKRPKINNQAYEAYVLLVYVSNHTDLLVLLPSFNFLSATNSVLKYIFYLPYTVFSEYNLAFLSVIFGDQAIFHTQCVDTFIAYLCMKFHLTKTDCLLAVAIKREYCYLQIAILCLTKSYLKSWIFLTV